MNAPAVAAVPQGQSLQVGQAVIAGRLSSIRKAGEKLFEHLLVMPAADPYSSPSTVCILSERRLGDKDEDVRVRVRIAGYRRSYKSTDPDSGEVRTVQTADNKLFAVD